MNPQYPTRTRLSEMIRVHGRHMNTLVFLLGFVLDILTLPRIDHPLVPYIVGGHMAIIGGSILLDRVLSLRASDRFEGVQKIFPFLASFSFGAVLSFLLVYYARSSALGASWPFLLLIAGIMFGSEFFRKKLEGLRFYVILYIFLSVLLAILFVPMILGQITPWTFLVAVSAGLLFSSAYLGILFLVTRTETRLILPRTLFFVGGGVALLLASYVLGIMPAIPLVLKEGEVCRRVVHTGDEYLCERDSRAWYEGILAPRVHTWTPGSPVYFYSAVFTPANLSGTIVHEWQMKDRAGDWVSVSRIPFQVVGGREGGYRGYTYKESVDEGLWRVVVALGDGRVIGRVPFRIKKS